MSVCSLCGRSSPAQNRVRLYIVGQKTYVREYPIEFPKPRAPVLLSSIMDCNQPPRDNLGPWATGQLAKAMAKLMHKGHNPKVELFGIDIGSSKPHGMFQRLPCLTASRCSSGGHYLSNQGRKTSVSEMLRAQGFDPKKVDTTLMSPARLGEAIGNAMTQTVLEAILAKLLPSMGW